MPDIGARRLLICVSGALLVLLLGAMQLRRAAVAPGGRPPAAAPIRMREGGSGPAVVHVAGAVRRPGVYTLPASARVNDAVRRAGGATRRADLGGLNLAAKVEDGRQVLVPKRVIAGAGGGSAAPAAAPAKGRPLNLNTATLEQLDQLSGVGPVTAQKILDYRAQKGGFGSVDELGEVPGIGDMRLATLREEVRL